MLCTHNIFKKSFQQDFLPQRRKGAKDGFLNGWMISRLEGYLESLR